MRQPHSSFCLLFIFFLRKQLSIFKETNTIQYNRNIRRVNHIKSRKYIIVNRNSNIIRNIVDKTASFVDKNGPEFEKRIMSSNKGNPKFNFLNGSDPYHAYYQHLVSVYFAKNQSGPQLPPDGSVMESAPSAPDADDNDSADKPDHLAHYRPVHKDLEPPEAAQYTVHLPEGITGVELDLIKLTAQFVARNEKPFLNENSCPEFHFLKPTHSMFMFFTSLTNAYSKVLQPPEGLADKMAKSVTDVTTVLERCLNRLEWERSQEQARQKAEDEIEQERLQMSMIDWHDFVVVENIDFADDEDEDLPPSMTLEEVIRKSKMSTVEEEEIIELGMEDEMEMDEEEVQLVEEGNGEDRKNESEITPEEQEAPMRIVENWKRPEDRIPVERDPTKYVVSQITNELIPIHEMSEHMRISLIDPKYTEQKERMFAKLRETTLAQDDEILRNIVGLARTRPDIFGTTQEEVSNAVKAEIEKKNDEQLKQVIWDGHTGSVGRTTTQAMSQNANGEDQMDGVFSGNLAGPVAPPLRPVIPSLRPLPPPLGLALNLPRVPPNTVQYSPLFPPPPPMQMSYGQQPYMMNRPPPPMPPSSISVNPPSIQLTPLAPRFPMPMVPLPPMPLGMSPSPPPEEAPPPLPEEPEPKRQRLDDSLLIPENQFLARHSGPARIAVSVPNMDEGNLKGQVLEITVQSLSETVGSLKEKIAVEIQFPGNKQKLSGKAGFLKDNLSLAYYNIAAGESLALSLRERGGRKR